METPRPSFNPGLSNSLPTHLPTAEQSTRTSKAARHSMQAERIDYGMRHGVHAGMHALSDSAISIDKYNV